MQRLGQNDHNTFATADWYVRLPAKQSPVPRRLRSWGCTILAVYTPSGLRFWVSPGGILIRPYTLLEVYTSAALHFWWSTLSMNFGPEEPLTKSWKSAGLVVYARGGLRYAGCTLKMGRHDHKQCRHNFLTQQLIS